MAKQRKQEMIRNFRQLSGGETPYYFGRMLYKYVACGPWTNYALRYVVGQRPVDINGVWRLTFRKSIKGPVFLHARRLHGKNRPPADLPKRVAEIGDIADMTWPQLCAVKPEGDFILRVKLKDQLTCLVDVRVKDAETHIPHPTMYYEAPEARDMRMASRIIGVEVGSIVEGSDVEIGPEELMFPFTRDEFDQLVERIDQEADFYWRRDNTDNYRLYHDDEPMGYVAWTQFDDEPVFEEEDVIPPAVRKAWIAWYGEVTHVRNYGVRVPFGPKGWTCEEWLDDSTY